MKFLQIPVIAFTMIICTGCQEKFDARLQKECKEYTQSNCPEIVEPGTILDSITYNSEQKKYTLWYCVTEENSRIMQEHTTLLHQMLLSKLVNDVSCKVLKDKGVNFQYVYRKNTNHSVIYQTTITKKEYCK